MRDIIEQLAQWIYETDVALAIAGEHDCRFYVRRLVPANSFESFDGEAAIRDDVSIVPYKDLPDAMTEDYFKLASKIIQGGAHKLSSWYDRMGIARPAVTLAHLRGD
jgi:hypothetical protein